MAAALPQTHPDPRSRRAEAPWALDTQGAAFHFDSDDALREGVDRARAQSWVADYFVDDVRRTLWIRFRGGAETAALRH